MEQNEKVQQTNVEGNAEVKKSSENRRSNNEGKKFNKDRRQNNPKAHRVEESPYEDRVIKVKRVTKVVKGGKNIRFSVLVVTGDRKGVFGYATGKSAEVPEAIKKASDKAKANLFRIQRVGGDTIAHTVIGKFGATEVFLKPALEGTGVIAGGAVRSILELAGIRNIYSKVYGSRTPINIIRATVNGLRQLKPMKRK